MIFYTSVEFAAETSDIPLFVDTAIADMNKSVVRKQACYTSCTHALIGAIPPIGEIHQFSKNVVTFEPTMRF